MVELRKRKDPPAARPPPPKRAASSKGAISKETSASGAGTGVEKPEDASGPRPKGPVAVGKVIDLNGFGGTVQLNDGVTTTLKELVGLSVSGVVLFTYPKANTPGCTKQACLFRDAYQELISTGFAIYGLSLDSPKSNSSFKSKQNLPYTLLCDTEATLIGALGLKKPPKSTTRGVVVINKEGKVLASMAGGPDATVEAVWPAVKAAD